MGKELEEKLREVVRASNQLYDKLVELVRVLDKESKAAFVEACSAVKEWSDLDYYIATICAELYNEGKIDVDVYEEP